MRPILIWCLQMHYSNLRRPSMDVPAGKEAPKGGVLPNTDPATLAALRRAVRLASGAFCIPRPAACQTATPQALPGGDARNWAWFASYHSIPAQLPSCVADGSWLLPCRCCQPVRCLMLLSTWPSSMRCVLLLQLLGMCSCRQQPADSRALPATATKTARPRMPAVSRHAAYIAQYCS